MQTDKYLERHDSQIARLEQVMTALAEAQVKTEESTDRLNLAMAELAKAQAKTEAEVAMLSAETRALGRQWQAYLNTLPKN
jgi:chromosome segregation ATPase